MSKAQWTMNSGGETAVIRARRTGRSFATWNSGTSTGAANESGEADGQPRSVVA